jgi:hypothetical protein
MTVDSLWTAGGRSGPHADSPAPLDRRSDELPAAKPHPPGRLTRELATTRQTHDKHEARGQSAGQLRTVRGPVADSPPAPNRIARAPKCESNLPYPSIDLPNSLSSWGNIWGRCESSLGGAMPQNLSPLTNEIVGNRIATELYQKLRFQPKMLQSKAESGDCGVMIKHKDTIHDPQQQIRTQTP